MSAKANILVAVLIAALMPSGAFVSFAQTSSPLTLEESKSLSDRQLVSRVFSQLADKVVHVQRMPGFEGGLKWFGSLQLMLRPEPADWYKGLCKARFIDLSFFEAPPYKVAKPRVSPIIPENDPPVVVHDMSLTTRYKITGNMARVREGVSPNDCESISEPSGFIFAPSADAVWQASWLMSLAAAQAKTGKVHYKLQCGSPADVCIKMVADVADQRLSGVDLSCAKAAVRNLNISPTSSCWGFIMSGVPAEARSGQQWQVFIVASLGGSLEVPTALIHQVILAPQMFVID